MNGKVQPIRIRVCGHSAHAGALGIARNSACEGARRCAFMPTKSIQTPSWMLFKIC